MRYAFRMDRPRSPLPHAKEVLAGYYREQGIMPSVQTLADLLGVSSTSSAHYIVQRLRDEGYLAANEFGKLTPGPQFHKALERPDIPTELLKELPAGEDLVVVRVQEEWRLEEGDFRAGDLLVLAPVESAANGDLLLLRRGSLRRVSGAMRTGWRAEGVLVGQYRAFRAPPPHGGES